MKKVLVCDDEQDILDILTWVLSGNGWEVVTTTHVDNIVEQVSKVRPSVILMDNWIPSSGGVIATQTLKSHSEFRNIPVIYITANTDIELLANQAGADFALQKPFDLDALERLVRDAINRDTGV